MDARMMLSVTALTKAKVGAAVVAAAGILFPAALWGSGIADLSSDDPAVRITAAKALAAGDPVAPESIPALVRALSDPYLEVRDGAARALGKAGRDAVAPLAAALARDDYHSQVWAATALGHLGGAAAQPTVVHALIANARLSGPDAQRQLMAAWALVRIGPTNAVFSEPLERAYREAADAVTRQYLAATLMGVDGGGRTTLIADAIANLQSDESARTILLGAGAAAVGPLTEKLKGPDKRTAAAIIDCLGSMGTVAKEAIPALIREVETPRDAWIGSFAVNALAKVGPADDRVKAVFEKAASGQPGPMADAARKALSGAGKKEAP